MSINLGRWCSGVWWKSNIDGGGGDGDIVLLLLLFRSVTVMTVTYSVTFCLGNRSNYSGSGRHGRKEGSVFIRGDVSSLYCRRWCWPRIRKVLFITVLLLLPYYWPCVLCVDPHCIIAAPIPSDRISDDIDRQKATIIPLFKSQTIIIILIIIDDRWWGIPSLWPHCWRDVMAFLHTFTVHTFPLFHVDLKFVRCYIYNFIYSSHDLFTFGFVLRSFIRLFTILLHSFTLHSTLFILPCLSIFSHICVRCTTHLLGFVRFVAFYVDWFSFYVMDTLALTLFVRFYVYVDFVHTFYLGTIVVLSNFTPAHTRTPFVYRTCVTRLFSLCPVHVAAHTPFCDPHALILHPHFTSHTYVYLFAVTPFRHFVVWPLIVVDIHCCCCLLGDIILVSGQFIAHFIYLYCYCYLFICFILLAFPVKAPPPPPGYCVPWPLIVNRWVGGGWWWWWVSLPHLLLLLFPL